MTEYSPILQPHGSDDKTELFLRPADVLKFLERRRGLTIFLSVTMFTYSNVPDEDGKNGRGFDLDENLKVSVKQASSVLERKARFAKQRFDKDGTEVRVRVMRMGHCVFM